MPQDTEQTQKTQEEELTLEQRAMALDALRQNPHWHDILEMALKVQAEGEEKHRQANSGFQYLGWEWFDVGAEPASLRRMVTNRPYAPLKVTYSSRSATNYAVKQPLFIREALDQLKEEGIGIQTGDLSEEIPPEQLFEGIIGHENIKKALQMALYADEPVHVLLVGPPATAKTLFLERLCRLQGSRYVLGSAVSRAGLVDYLLEVKPRYLVYDELEKADGRDLSALLSVMQTGIVTRLKKGMREQEHLKTWVFAGSNDASRLPRELRSRFLVIALKEYTEAEFRQVCLGLLKRKNLSEAMANLIVGAIIPHTRDPRDALKIGNLAKSPEDVKTLVKIMYRGT